MICQSPQLSKIMLYIYINNYIVKPFAKTQWVELGT